MTLLGQALHVARKDLREARWLAIAFVLTLTATTLHATELLLDSTWQMSFISLIMFMVASLFVAQVVQADSPTRIDAFWVSRPLSMRAVFLAKLISLAGIGLCATVAQAIAAVAIDLPAGEVMLSSALAGASLVAVMLWAAVLAAVTRNLISLILTVISVLVFVYLLTYLVPSALSWSVQELTATTASVPWLIVGILVPAAFVWYQYRRRSERRGQVILVSLIACNILTGQLGIGDEPTQIRATGLATGTDELSRAATFRVSDWQVNAADSSKIELYVTLQALTSNQRDRYNLTAATVKLESTTDADSRKQSVKKTRISVPLLNKVEPAEFLVGLTSITPGPEQQRQAQVAAIISAAQERRLVNGELQPVVLATVSVARPALVADLPTKRGSRFHGPGKRLSISEVPPRGFPDLINLRTSELWRAAWPVAGFPLYYRFSKPGFEYYVVHQPSAQVAQVVPGGWMSGGSPLPFAVGGATSRVTSLRVADHPGATLKPEVPDSWMANALLRVVEWGEVASYRTTIAPDSATRVAGRRRR